MQVLGIADGRDAGAALVIDDGLVADEMQASFDGRARSRNFPWDAISDVLRRAGSEAGEVSTIAIAGRFSPPLIARKRPYLTSLAARSFAPVLDLGVFYQAMLRQTGWGALQADAAATWMADRMASRGFRGRLFLVDSHTALANAAYRFQDQDDVLICTLHPLGDGVSLAVHRAAYGQIDRVYEQKGFSALHVHLRRCAEQLGCEDVRSMWSLAGDAEPDPTLTRHLRRMLHAEGPQLSRAWYPLPQRRSSYDVFRGIPFAVAAASVRANLASAVTAVIGRHVADQRCGVVLLAGEAFEDPVLVDAIRHVPGVRHVGAPAEPGPTCLARGAAAHAAGLAPSQHTPLVRDPECGVHTVSVDEIEAALKAGRSIARFSGRSVLDPFGTGDRCLWSTPTSERPPCTLDARWVSLDAEVGPFVMRPREGTLLHEVVERVGTLRVEPLVFGDRPVSRLEQVVTASRGPGWLVSADERR